LPAHSKSKIKIEPGEEIHPSRSHCNPGNILHNLLNNDRINNPCRQQPHYRSEDLAHGSTKVAGQFGLPGSLSHRFYDVKVTNPDRSFALYRMEVK
jgi:hypothetical protein